MDAAMEPSALSDSPEQVLPESLNPQAAPADTSGSEVGGTDASEPQAAEFVQDIESWFTQILDDVATGNWQGLHDTLYEAAVNVGGILLANGLKALAVFLVLYVIHRLVDRTLDQILTHSRGIEPGLQGLLQKSYRVIAFVFIGAIVLGQVGVNVTALVAGLSIAGIALGFAARDSLENFIAGVTILLDQPFKVGDFIVVQDHYGQVDEITLRSTRIRSVRNEILVLPNTQMITTQVVNHTKQHTLRVDIDFGIAYKEYPKEAREVVLRTVEDDDRLLPSPSPTVVVTALADSSVNMALRFYIRDPSQEVALRWEYTEKVREALREADIEIPFPHRQLFLDEARGLHDSSLFRQTSNGTASTSDPSSA
jgi:small conductance mechanosensitive channel